MIHRDKPAPETEYLTHSQHRHEPLISIPPKSAFRSHQSRTRLRVGWHAGPASFHRGQPRIAKSSTRLWALSGSLGRLGCTATHTHPSLPPAWRRRRNAKGLGSTKNRTTFPSFFYNLYIIFTTYPLLLSNHPFIFVSWIITWGWCIFTWTDGEFGLFGRVVAALLRRPRPMMVRMVRIICLIFVGGVVNRFPICLYACAA